jgi:hypothetical protein
MQIAAAQRKDRTMVFRTTPVRALIVLGLAAIVSVIILTGCSMSAARGADDRVATTSLTREEATEIARHRLEAFNDGDYVAWSQDWSDSMKSAIKERDFLSFRDSQMNRLGEYLTIKEASFGPAKTDGYVLWKFTVEYEHGDQVLVLTFPESGDTIHGVRVEELS